MTEHEIFNHLFSGGRFALPYLIKFSHPTAGTIRLVNNNQSVQFEGEQYEVSTFLYTEPNNKGEAGTLEITAVDNTLIEFVENADYRFRLDVVGVLIEDGTIQKIVNCGGVSGQRCVMNIFLCIIRSITVLMKNRENSRFLPSMKALTQERLNKSFLPGRK